MSKIRINELARELEVKPSIIIDLLPEFGVSEKKTHSSSVDEDVALKIKARLEGGGRPAPEPPPLPVVVLPPRQQEAAPPAEAETREEPVAQVAKAPFSVPIAAPHSVATHSAPHSAPQHVPTHNVEPEAKVAEPAPNVMSASAPPFSSPANIAPPAIPAAPPVASPAPPLAPRAADDSAPAAPPAPTVAKAAAPPVPPKPAAPSQDAPPARPSGFSFRPPLATGTPFTPPLATGPGAPTPKPSAFPPKPSLPPKQAFSSPLSPRPTAPTPGMGQRPAAPPAAPQAPSAPASAQPQSSAPGAPTPAAPANAAPGSPAAPAAPIAAAPIAAAPGTAAPANPSAPAAPAASQGPGAPAAGQAPRPPGPPRQTPPAAVILGGNVPQINRPGAPAPSAPRPPAPRPNFLGAGGQGQQNRPAGPNAPAPPRPPQPGSSRPLVGQPQARPVVPPSPEMLNRLRQLQQATPAPGQAGPRPPSASRPGAPTQRPGGPAPGRPIYAGPRPGQPSIRPAGPGMPGPGGGPGGPMGGRPGQGRGRGMHPTAGGSRLEPPPPVPLPGATDARRDTSKRARDRAREIEFEEGKLKHSGSRRNEETVKATNTDITISEGITVKELADKMGIKTNLVIKKLVERKIFATINQTLDVKMAQELAQLFGAQTSQVSYEEEKSWEVELAEDPKDLVMRAPVVTIMGHVDHGKTSLLDAIRTARVAEREAGGITQHIGAYHVEMNGKKIVFIDTPGHEAFTRMRSRGAKVTDVVILVVAADDGVMPQTIEAIDHAKAANVPIIVAINKIDKEGAQIDRIKQQLSDRGLLAEDWGGTTVMVPVSAKARTNLDLLLEMILLTADIANLKANPTRPALGNVLEAQLDRGRGPVATMLVRNGTLRVGDHVLCGSVFGKVRAMFDDRGNPVREADPSTPVEVLGLDSLPEVGDTFQVVIDTAKAKQIVIYRERQSREAAMAKAKARMSLDALHAQMQEGDVKELNIIIKGDVGGSAEVLSDTLHKLSTEKVRIRVIHTGVGAITETDVLLASASNAIIIGFNVKPERTAQAVADREKIDIRQHSIIYEVVDEMKKAMVGLLAPVFKEAYRGRAEVRSVFRISKVGNVAGSYVTDGVIGRTHEARLTRAGAVIYTGKISQLKRFKDDASEVKFGYECGITLSGFNDLQEGDIIETFITEKIIQVSLN